MYIKELIQKLTFHIGFGYIVELSPNLPSPPLPTGVQRKKEIEIICTHTLRWAFHHSGLQDIHSYITIVYKRIGSYKYRNLPCRPNSDVCYHLLYPLSDLRCTPNLDVFYHLLYPLSDLRCTPNLDIFYNLLYLYFPTGVLRKKEIEMICSHTLYWAFHHSGL